MKKGVLFLLFGLIFLVSCANVDKEIVCESPYIRFADSCCLDADANKICDNDETTTTTVLQSTETTLPGETTTTTLAVEDLPRGNLIGKENANLTVEVYADISEISTAQFYEQIIDKLRTDYYQTDYVNNGKAAFRFYHAPSKFDYGLNVALATECASDQGAWKSYLVLVLKNPDLLDNGNLKWYARALSLDTARFNSCFDSKKYLDRVNEDYAKSIGVGYEDIHVYYIGEDRYELPMSLSKFKDELNKKLV